MNADTASRKVKAVSMRSEGANWPEIAAALGVDRKTLWRWRQDDEPFAAACAEADERCIDALENALEIAALKIVEDPRYTTAMIFALKNKRPSKWRDVGRIEHGGAVDLALLPPDEVARRAALLDED